jgi:DNA-binding MarR family transcriptional regulator
VQHFTGEGLVSDRQDELPAAIPPVTGGSHERAAAAVQTHLAQVIRHARLPRVHRRVMSDSRVFIDRGGYATLFNVDVLGRGSMSDLAAEMLLDLSTVSRQVRRLVDAGLVERERDPDDRRVTLLRTTPEGHDIAQRITLAWQTAFDESLAEWDARDVERLADSLGRLSSSLRAYTER